jgi:tRNA 2-thiouridine synthesizing protein E
VLDGVAFGPDGHLDDPNAWTPSLAQAIAAAEGIALDEPRLRIIEIARSQFVQSGVSPNIRKLTQVAELSTKDLYALFPKAPARTIAKIAGIPKPAGCL